MKLKCTIQNNKQWQVFFANFRIHFTSVCCKFLCNYFFACCCADHYSFEIVTTLLANCYTIDNPLSSLFKVFHQYFFKLAYWTIIFLLTHKSPNLYFRSLAF